MTCTSIEILLFDNFVFDYRNPNLPNAVTWPRFTFEDEKYLMIGKQDTVKTKPDRNRCQVWRKKFRAVIDDDLIQKLKNSKS